MNAKHAQRTVRRSWVRVGTAALAVLLTFLLCTQTLSLPTIAVATEGASQQATQTEGTTDQGTQASDSATTNTAADESAAPVETDDASAAPADDATVSDGLATLQNGGSAPSEVENNLAGEGSNSIGSAAPAEDPTVSVALDLSDQATVKYNDTEYTAETENIDAPAGEELAFTAAAAEGFQISAVKQIAAGVETELQADEATGEYKVAVDAVAEGLTIKVETEAVVASDETAGEAVEGEQPAADAEQPAAGEEAVEGEEPAEDATTTPEEEVVTEVTDAIENALTSAPLLGSAMLLNTGLPLPVTIRLYDEQNNVVETTEATIASGALTETTAPEREGYYFLDATVGEENVPIAYAEAHEGDTVYYAVEENAVTGILLGEDEAIYLNYKELGNSVPVHYTTSGADDVAGNEVVGFPQTAVKGQQFSFQVALTRGYEAHVTIDGRTIEPSSEASGTNTYALTVNEESTVNVEFVKAEAVKFDPGVFGDSSYMYLYDNGSPRFTFGAGSDRVQEQPVGDKGADFTFTFTTKGNWQMDSLQINGIYLSVPHTRAAGEIANTVLYSDGSGRCIATLEVTRVQGDNATYRLAITGAKEDLEITNANLNGSGWHEVIPTAADGIYFESSPNRNGQFVEGGLNKPFATDASTSDSTPKFRFHIENGYKNPEVHVYAYNGSGGTIVDEVVQLPGNGDSAKVTVEFHRDGHWEGWHWVPAGNVTATLATITNNNGTYTIQYENSNEFDGSGIELQFVEITCEKATYGVKYDLNGGTGDVSDSSTYDVVDNTAAVVTNRMPEASEGQIFLGWKIKGNESGPMYNVGDALDFTSDDIFEYVSGADDRRDGYLTLVAQYTDKIAYGSSRPVLVKYYFENENGTYIEDEIMRGTVQGIAGKQLSMLQYEKR